jgi:hypothetical protein
VNSFEIAVGASPGIVSRPPVSLMRLRYFVVFRSQERYTSAQLKRNTLRVGSGIFTKRLPRSIIARRTAPKPLPTVGIAFDYKNLGSLCVPRRVSRIDIGNISAMTCPILGECKAALVDRELRNGSRSADRTDVSFLREFAGGFRKELRADQGRVLPTADVGYAVAQLGGQLSGCEIAHPTGAGRPKAVPRDCRLRTLDLRQKSRHGRDRQDATHCRHQVIFITEKTALQRVKRLC